MDYLVEYLAGAGVDFEKKEAFVKANSAAEAIHKAIKADPAARAGEVAAKRYVPQGEKIRLAVAIDRKIRVLSQPEEGDTD